MEAEILLEGQLVFFREKIIRLLWRGLLSYPGDSTAGSSSQECKLSNNSLRQFLFYFQPSLNISSIDVKFSHHFSVVPGFQRALYCCKFSALKKFLVLVQLKIGLSFFPIFEYVFPIPPGPIASWTSTKFLNIVSLLLGSRK